MKKRKLPLCIALCAAVPVLLCSQIGSAEAKTAMKQQSMSVQFDGMWESQSVHQVVVGNTSYMRLSDIAPILRTTLHIQSTVAAGRWQWTLPTGWTTPTAGKGAAQSAELPVTMNGVAVANIAAVQQAGETYVSIAGLITLLRQVDVVGVWQWGSTLSLFSPVSMTQLRAYQTAHPKWKIGFVHEATIGRSKQPALIVENNPPGTPGQMVLSVVSPNLQVHDFPTDAWAPFLVQSMTSPSVNWIAAQGINEDVDERLFLIGGSSEQPRLIREFHGTDGVAVWLQNGKPMVMTSTGLKGVPGNPDDFEARRQVYLLQNSSWKKSADFVTGGYNFEPSLQTNPDVAAMTFLQVNDGPSILPQATDPLYKAASAATQALRADKRVLQSLPGQDPTRVISISASVGTNGATRTYSLQEGAYKLWVSLAHRRWWTITGFRLIHSGGA